MTNILSNGTNIGSKVGINIKQDGKQPFISLGIQYIMKMLQQFVKEVTLIFLGTIFYAAIGLIDAPYQCQKQSPIARQTLILAS